MKRFLLLVASTLPLLLASSHAAAEGDADPATQRMRERFDHGLADYDAKKYDVALGEFREAFAAKPLPAIRRNIALCERELGLFNRAVDDLEAMLREEGDRIDPRVKDATLKAIQEMSPRTATVRLGFRDTSGAELRTPEITVSLDGEVLSPERAAGPIRVLPGRPEISASAPGYYPGFPPPGFVVQAGDSDKPLVLELMPDPNDGFLRVRTSTPGAKATIDSDACAIGRWKTVAIGTHSVRVVAQGYRDHVETVTVDGGRPRDVDVNLEDAIPPVPPPPEFGANGVEAAPAPAEAEPDRRFFGLVGLTLQGQRSSFLVPVDSLQNQDLGGAGAAVKLGYRLNRYLYVDLAGELGVSKVQTGAPNARGVDDDVVLADWVLAPELRVQTPGKVRFVSSLGLGVEGSVVSGTLYEAPTGTGGTPVPRDLNGSGAGWAVLGEIGGQLQLKRAFLELGLFLDVHDVRGVADDSGARMFQDATATRAGIRFSLGYPF